MGLGRAETGTPLGYRGHAGDTRARAHVWATHTGISSSSPASNVQTVFTTSRAGSSSDGGRGGCWAALRGGLREPQAVLPQLVHAARTGADRRPHVRTGLSRAAPTLGSYGCHEPPPAETYLLVPSCPPSVLREREAACPPWERGLWGTSCRPGDPQRPRRLGAGGG